MKFTITGLLLVAFITAACGDESSESENPREELSDEVALNVSPVARDDDREPMVPTTYERVAAEGATTLVATLVQLDSLVTPPCDGSAKHPAPYLPAKLDVDYVLSGDSLSGSVDVDLFSHEARYLEPGTQYLVSLVKVDGVYSNSFPLMKVDSGQDPQPVDLGTPASFAQELNQTRQDFQRACPNTMKVTRDEMEARKQLEPIHCIDRGEL